MHPEYLTDAQRATSGDDAGGPVDLHNRGLELTRHSRAAKLWLTLRTYGLDALASAVGRGVAMAEEAEGLARDRGLEIVTPASLGIVTVAVPGLDDAGHQRLAAALTADGYAARATTSPAPSPPSPAWPAERGFAPPRSVSHPKRPHGVRSAPRRSTWPHPPTPPVR
jgi:glutamate/tyrosine decarboxylase-like PLP-dependent enzyme